MPETQDILLEQLQVGLYVHLDLKWFEHPFAFSHFKIKSQEQIHQLRSLGLQRIRIDPALSDVQPVALQVDAPVAVSAESAGKPSAPMPETPELAAKRAMMERMRQQRENAARIEHAFVDTAREIKDMEKNLFARPAESLQKASEMIGKIADSILSAPELAIHVMGDRTGGEEIYLHSLNVTMLSMMIARDIKLPREVASAMGVGSMFHDLGVRNIPDKVLTKSEAWTHSEQNLYETHCAVGTEMGQQLKFPAAAVAIVRDHHEMYDGSGYPRHLKGEEIGVLARIVAIANYYDRLCNPVNGTPGLTPHEALSLMFAKNRGKFDPKLLQVFIRCLGVYPPGTIVQLSNGATGMVATINTEKPNKPELVVYEPGVPREDAIMVDMDRESDLNIVRAIKPSQVPKEIYAYLSPRKRVSYYFDATKPGQGATG
ncbi:HDIG domain-containing protein [Duganella sp. CF458]|uniref:HD-GYP domain-containing protein n=1 Tax=Duganella sp. CF458 TaxID=1884368 RepID=UPI0008E115A4|nr:HD domain-containing phosphohydrolase [Duganella sp. CF458]SFG17942.1 HDIG domain-containing protein [Duganella sp. CF458]